MWMIFRQMMIGSWLCGERVKYTFECGYSKWRKLGWSWRRCTSRWFGGHMEDDYLIVTWKLLAMTHRVTVHW
jgi:hypothetical protein